MRFQRRPRTQDCTSLAVFACIGINLTLRTCPRRDIALFTARVHLFRIIYGGDQIIRMEPIVSLEGSLKGDWGGKQFLRS